MATSEEARRLNQRINSASRSTGVPVPRLRNRIAFQRILARLATDGAWVLKGGFGLDMRLGLTARSTRDLDLWRLGMAMTSALDLQDLLDVALEGDLGDGFTFRVGLPRQLRLQDAEPSTWRVGVGVHLDGSLFTESTVDIVLTLGVAPDETEPMLIEPVLVGDPFTIKAIDLARHAAEKYHACVRIYARDRPSTRVKDLVDLVLLIEGGFLDDARLGRALRRVFDERNQTQPPNALPERPPADWAVTFTSLAGETGATITDIGPAWALASLTYQRALAQEGDA